MSLPKNFDFLEEMMKAEFACRTKTITIPTKKRQSEPCSRCGGSGWISCFKHVEVGRCFKCGGSGR